MGCSCRVTLCPRSHAGIWLRPAAEVPRDGNRPCVLNREGDCESSGTSGITRWTRKESRDGQRIACSGSGDPSKATPSTCERVRTSHRRQVMARSWFRASRSPRSEALSMTPGHSRYVNACLDSFPLDAAKKPCTSTCHIVDAVVQPATSMAPPAWHAAMQREAATVSPAE